MPNMRSSLVKRRGTRFFSWMAYLLVIAGGAALGWSAANLTDAYIAQWRAREQLASMPPMTMSTPSASSPRSSALSTPRSSRVQAGTPLAELSIPRIGLSAVVLEGSDDHTLRVGLGHIESTSLPGESGNVAIAGHRDSFFRPLRNVQVGDDITLDTPTARVHYRVSSYSVVNSDEVSVIDPTTDARLTLVTCFPFQFIGSAPDRFIVRANYVADVQQSHAAPVVPRPSTAPPPRATRPRSAQSASLANRGSVRREASRNLR
jgi:sortase A